MSRSGESPEDLSYSIFIERMGSTPTRSCLDYVRPRAPSWVPDQAVKRCQECSGEFWMLNRRHHCRSCGRVVCAKCSGHSLSLPKWLDTFPEEPPGWFKRDTNQPQRVCGSCYTRYSEAKTLELWLLIFAWLDLDDLRRVSMVSTGMRRAANVLRSQFRDIQYVLPGYALTLKQKNLLMRNFHLLPGHSRYLVKLLTSISWKDPREVAKIEALLKQYRILDSDSSRPCDIQDMRRLSQMSLSAPKSLDRLHQCIPGSNTTQDNTSHENISNSNAANGNGHRRRNCHAMMCTRFCASQLTGLEVVELLEIPISSLPIRNWLINRLETLTDETVESILLQLCFSLRFEPETPHSSVHDSSNPPPSTSSEPLQYTIESGVQHGYRLSNFLFRRGKTNPTIRFSLYWCLIVLRSWRRLVFTRFYQAYICYLNAEIGPEKVQDLIRSRQWGKQLELLRDSGLPNSDLRREEIVQSLERTVRLGVGIPYSPDFRIQSLDFDGIVFCESASRPLWVPVTGTSESGELITQRVMVKSETLIKDYVVMNLIRLIDRILQADLGIDFGIKTYAVLPMTLSSGLIELIPRAKTLYAIQHRDNLSILNYLIRYNPDVPGAELQDRFVKSAAAYCVIPYLFGVGDRHMENIMVSQDGYLFHIDYGYILGFDPKPLAPAMRITKPIIEAIGGLSSPNYARFREYCGLIYRCLRLHTATFSTLLSILTENGLGLDSRLTSTRLHHELLVRFRPGESSTEAEQQLQIEIDDSYKSHRTQAVFDLWHYYIRESKSGGFRLW